MLGSILPAAVGCIRPESWYIILAAYLKVQQCLGWLCHHIHLWQTSCLRLGSFCLHLLMTPCAPAGCIRRAWRGYLGSSHRLLRHAAATSIQAQWRARHARCQAAHLRKQNAAAKRLRSAAEAGERAALQAAATTATECGEQLQLGSRGV